MVMTRTYTNWTDDLIHKRALKFNDRGTFSKEDVAAYTAAHVRGKQFLDRVCSHMLPLRETWSIDKVLEVGRTCKNQMELRKLYYGAYKYAYRNNMIDQIQFKNKKKITRWTDKEIFEKALQCKTKIEFERRFLGACKAARKRNILEEACRHMQKDVGCSYPEKEIFSFVSKIHPNCKKLRIRKIKIPNKPWIYGFDIDIFVPNINLGVEFDGDYWHSFEILKRSKKKWPDEDIRNYHNIKDEYFATKGIKILHIRWEDWKNDKNTCLSKITTFLS